MSKRIPTNKMYARGWSLPEVRDRNDDQQVERCREKRHEDHQTFSEYDSGSICCGSPAGCVQEMWEAQFITFKGLHLQGHKR